MSFKFDVLYFHFHSVQYFIISLRIPLRYIHYLELFAYFVFGEFPIIFLLFVSCLILLGLENILNWKIFSILLSLLRLVLWPRIWSVFTYVSGTLEKNVCKMLL